MVSDGYPLRFGFYLSFDFKMVVQESEAITIKFILDKVKQNQSEAAKILGMNRGTLKKKIELYKL
jgi:Fis family transcriptional regulator